MKTATIELSDVVFNQLAKDAERRHQPLGTYVAELLAKGMAQSATVSALPRQEPELPLIHSSQPGSAAVTNEMISELELREDAERYGRSAGR